ncbi:hypothetical protein ACIBEA_12135 [Streptomyces sp. NPDC051555]|uniref:hypothetical protein n=1 Tax=Streptomyces sp. NPDC051555 TaxID=3365657 RepID=UPI00378BE26B
MLLKVWIEARLRMMDGHEEDRGQTAFEYLGIILVVVVIIGAIVGSGIGTAITDRIAAAVAAITAG